ncbi:MAG: MarR family transcriptional regulator [Microbacterium sp.]|nr:MarR family transcriptional regulator [Microbacterium sp.]
MSSEIADAVAALGPIVQRYQAAVDDFDRETARLLGVNGTDQRCLELLVDAGDDGLAPRDIADRLALTTGSVTTMLDRLEKAGYVSRSPHPSDGRRLVVRLTDAARERIWSIIGPHIAESGAAVAERFTAQELDEVRRFLELVTDVQNAHVLALRARPTS